MGAGILALQETHLAAMPLQWAHASAREAWGALHHGRPVAAVSGGTFGRSCGVGFVAQAGLAVVPVLPQGSAWRWLHAAGRLHAVRLPPRAGLPRGLLVMTVYAPLQVRLQAVERRKYAEALADVTYQLDMQEPVLLVGDFNGSVCPDRDFMGESGARRECCGLLGRLLGPGAAWVDVQVALGGAAPLDWTFQLVDREGRVSASRIDLVLANHAAFGLIRRLGVLGDIRDGGHSPVVVELRVSGPVAIDWRAPRPRPPGVLLLPSDQLRGSGVWAELVEQWLALPGVRALDLDANPGWTTATLSAALLDALQGLVRLAGGWNSRGPQRRAAYDSSALRGLRRRIGDLHRVESLTRPATQAGAGCWPRALVRAVESVRAHGVSLPQGSVGQLREAALRELALAKTELGQRERAMRRERQERWRAALPGLWMARPGVVHHWLQAPAVAWGTFPVLDEHGLQCLTVPEVDRAVRAFWVDGVLRKAAGGTGGLAGIGFWHLSSPLLCPGCSGPPSLGRLVG